MSAEHSDRWVDWAQEIQALAQTGQHYAADGYQSARYRRLIEISAEIFADHTRLSQSQLMEVFYPQTGYATPRVDVRGAVFQHGKLLIASLQLHPAALQFDEVTDLNRQRDDSQKPLLGRSVEDGRGDGHNPSRRRLRAEYGRESGAG